MCVPAEALGGYPNPNPNPRLRAAGTALLCTKCVQVRHTLCPLKHAWWRQCALPLAYPCPAPPPSLTTCVALAHNRAGAAVAATAVCSLPPLTVAIATAISASVTVSMGELTIGVRSEMLRVILVVRSTSCAAKSMWPGRKMTSS
jgi:hypothetical protein